jgi:hypothetical protein
MRLVKMVLRVGCLSQNLNCNCLTPFTVLFFLTTKHTKYLLDNFLFFSVFRAFRGEIISFEQIM